MLKAYLGGAIRTEADYEWRREFTRRYAGRLVCLSPPDILQKTDTLATGADWFKKIEANRFRPGYYMTERTDHWMIERSDICVFNLLAMATGYPCIGSLIEIGLARRPGKFVLTVSPREIRAHPFIAFNSDGAYTSFDPLYTFLDRLLLTLSGHSPAVEEAQ